MDTFLTFVDDPKQRTRYTTLKKTLESLVPLFQGKRVLDFGASHGPAICAMLELGAREVIGIEPGREWVQAGQRIIESFGDRATLIHIEDTRHLPFEDAYFGCVLVNAVLEHIPQPRDEYIAEIWRLLAPDGHLIVNETPNKYFPKDVHTTGGLWLIPWLPSNVSRRIAVAAGRFRPDGDWVSSGWRGVGFYELTRPLHHSYELIPEQSRPRHRLLSKLGLPASIMDPYPCWVLQKKQKSRAAHAVKSAAYSHRS